VFKTSLFKIFLHLLTLASVNHKGTQIMKVFLDDERPTPEGWVHARWPDDAIAFLQTGNVTHLSLDHDLGDDEHGTGNDVVLWIEEAVATAGFIPPVLTVHSANASARLKMQAGIQSIGRMASQSSALV
jgi:hypothetical protein